MDLYIDFTLKLSSMIAKFQACQNELAKLRSDAKKHVDITLSILKSSLRGTDKYTVNRYSAQKMQLSELEEQLSAEHIKSNIANLLQAFKDTFVELNNSFGRKFYRKKKLDIQDSMELSYMEETRIMKGDKVPAKNELWLWDSWKDYDSYRLSNSLVLLDRLTEFYSKINIDYECGKYLEKYPCIMESRDNREIRGDLEVTEKELIFSNTGSSPQAMRVIIPFSDIQEDAVIKSKFIDDYIVIGTKVGKVNFKKFPDIQEALDTINHRISEAASNENEEVPTRQSVQLSPDELTFIAQRKQKIQGDLEKVDDIFEKYQELTFKGIGID